MRYAPGQKEKTRARILEAAGRVFRRHGYHAAGVDKVMEEAGLTAGGFYAHFESKQALLAEALTCADANMAAVREVGLEELTADEWFDAFLERYLNMEHCRKLEAGCPLAALISEISRADGPAKKSFEAIVRGLADKLSSHTRGSGAAPAEGPAFAAIALCVGGLGLARAVDDESLAERILDSCKVGARQILGTTEDLSARPRPRPRGKKNGRGG